MKKFSHNNVGLTVLSLGSRVHNGDIAGEITLAYMYMCL